MRYAHVVFDIDGTLLDTAWPDLMGLQAVLREELGVHRALEELHEALGAPSYDILEKFGVPEARRARLSALWLEKTHEHFDAVRLFPGVRETLARLSSAGLRLGIVTSKNAEEYALDVPPYGIEQYFDVVVNADDTREHKPRPAPLLKYLERAGARAEDALYVGDSVYDRDCAAAAGVDFALAQWGSVAADMEGPRYRLRRPEEIWQVVHT